jgi:hypothetical protein
MAKVPKVELTDFAQSGEDIAGSNPHKREKAGGEEKVQEKVQVDKYGEPLYEASVLSEFVVRCDVSWRSSSISSAA